MRLREIWRRITTTQYTRALREELAHAHDENMLLRAENRALLNSILGIAGVPPIPVAQDFSVGARPRSPIRGAETEHAVPAAAPSLSRSSFGDAENEQVVSASAAEANRSGASRLASPMRRRSWQQINRMLEFESAKKKASEAI
jgi:hypothetical protein